MEECNEMMDSNNLATVEIPLLKNQEIQMRINALAFEANRDRYEAYQLEQKDLQILEQEVIYAN